MGKSKCKEGKNKDGKEYVKGREEQRWVRVKWKEDVKRKGKEDEKKNRRTDKQANTTTSSPHPPLALMTIVPLNRKTGILCARYLEP